MSNHAILEHAKTFIYTNARLLDRRRFEFLFEDGSSETVIHALRAYQNPDGGFGNALEPDIRCPHSEPVPTEVALMVLDELGHWDSDVLDGIIRYLRNVTLTDGGLPWIFSSGSDYPRSPWWVAEAQAQPSVNPTGRLVGLLYKQNVREDFYDEPWFVKSVAYLWRSFEHEAPHGYHDGIQWITFLQETAEQNRAAKIWPVVEGWLRQKGTIETDPKATGYVQKVLDWAPTADSYAKQFIAPSDVEAHLDNLVHQQQEDGGWPINFPPLSPGVHMEWRGSITVDRLKTLRSYGILK
jgi:hypothetical protein